MIRKTELATATGEMITISYDTGEPMISGRELHEKLGISTRYNDWFSRMVEYGFVEGQEFYSNLSKTPGDAGGRPLTDHLLTLDMAKELCMIQRTDAGKRFRLYFIEAEKKYRAVQEELLKERAAREAERALPEWQQARQDGKGMRKELTDALKVLEERATAAGSKNGHRYYTNATIKINKLAGIESGGRDNATKEQLVICGIIEHIMAQALWKYLETESDYHDVYKKSVVKTVDVAAIVGYHPRALTSADH